MPDKDELPPGLALLWGQRESGRRGPKPELNVDAIVAAAISIANTEGLDAVSMAKVAKAVGFTTMSLYRHVSNKDELLQLMWNASAEGVDELELDGDDWRSRIRSWAIAQRDAIERNIWIVQMPMATPPLAPNSVTWMEKGLVALGDTGLPDRDKIRILGMFASHALIDARMAFDARRGAEVAGGPPVDYAVLLRQLIEPDRFPNLHRAVHSGDLDDDPKAGTYDEYSFDLEVMLDGIAALIARQQAT